MTFSIDLSIMQPWSMTKHHHTPDLHTRIFKPVWQTTFSDDLWIKLPTSRNLSLKLLELNYTTKFSSRTIINSECQRCMYQAHTRPLEEVVFTMQQPAVTIFMSTYLISKCYQVVILVSKIKGNYHTKHHLHNDKRQVRNTWKCNFVLHNFLWW